MDVRTSTTVDELAERLPDKNKNHYQKCCGVPLSTYFSGVKLRWLKDNVPEVAKSMAADNCLFGTVDSWLIYNLTGGPSGGVHITDVSNASRTMLMNIESCTWEPELLDFFELPPLILPQIRSSSEIYGQFADGPLKVSNWNPNNWLLFNNGIYSVGNPVVWLPRRSASGARWPAMFGKRSSESNLRNGLLLAFQYWPWERVVNSRHFDYGRISIRPWIQTRVCSRRICGYCWCSHNVSWIITLGVELFYAIFACL